MKFKYKIEGVDCPMCASKLATKMAEVDGVDRVTINFLPGRLTVESELFENAWLDEIKRVAKNFDSAIEITSK